MGIGELAALSAAFLWTVASMMWGRIHLSALGINLCKNWLACVFLLIHLSVIAALTGGHVFNAPARSWWYLAASGFVGIVIGDTYYFRSLQILGPRRALILASTSPLFAVALGWMALRESLAPVAVSGIVMTVLGVVVVVADRKAKREEPGIKPGNAAYGAWYGVLGALCQAGGGVFSKLGMTRSIDGEVVSECGALEATLIRLIIAAIGTLGIIVGKRQLLGVWRSLKHWPNTWMILPATICGTWVGIWMSQIAFKESEVAVAQTLHSTCPLFAIPMVWWLYGHKSTWYSILGTLIALVGIYLTVGGDLTGW